MVPIRFRIIKLFVELVADKKCGAGQNVTLRNVKFKSIDSK